jgi:tetratricopeptide (TPR) repeat protein
MIEEARSAFEKALRLVPYWDAAEIGLGIAYKLLGEKKKAEKLLEDLVQRKKTVCVSASLIAMLACELDQWEKAFDFLEMAFEERDSFMSYLQVFPEFAKLRSDARIKPLIRRMKFPK